jgi:hypothetical protein
MQLTYSAVVSLFFNIIPGNVDAFVPNWHEFKKSVVVETWLLNSQPFTYSHFCFLIIVESATSQSTASVAQSFYWEILDNPTQCLGR